ncbi:galactose oxidase [Russula decolorans]
MPLFSRKKLSFHGLASQSTKQPPPVCTWSAHTPQSGPSPLQFPRSSHTLTATADGELFLFGGYVHGHESTLPSRDLYAFSTRDFSATLLQTSGKVPTRRVSHGAALIGTTLLICGGKTNFLNQNALSQRQNDSLYRLNLESREWTRVVVNGPGPGGRYFHTVTMIRSKLFVFGGVMGGKSLNDVWALNSLNSQPFWESYEPAPGNEKPPPRTGHVSVSTEDRIIVFGGSGNLRHYNDTWSFDISARKWTELQCTGSIPSPRSGHAAVLVDGIMYVFGGYTGKAHLDDLIGLQLSTQRWFKFHNQGTSPCGRSNHAMASDGVRVFVLGGYSENARVESVDQFSLIHVFDTSMGHQVHGSRA